MNLYIVRHGNPNYNLDCLTELGHKQAEAAAEALETLEIDEIHSSSMGRAVETAEHLARRIGKEIILEPWVHEVEYYGRNPDGTPTRAIQMDATFLRSPELKAMGDDWMKHPLFCGEEGLRAMIDEVENGAADFMARQGYVLEGERFRIVDPAHPNDKNVALFCHAGSFLVLTSYLLQIPQYIAWHSLFMYQASYTWCNFANSKTGFAVGRYYDVNETSHLRAAGLPLT